MRKNQDRKERCPTAVYQAPSHILRSEFVRYNRRARGFSRGHASFRPVSSTPLHVSVKLEKSLGTEICSGGMLGCCWVGPLRTSGPGVGIMVAVQRCLIASFPAEDVCLLLTFSYAHSVEFGWYRVILLKHMRQRVQEGCGGFRVSSRILEDAERVAKFVVNVLLLNCRLIEVHIHEKHHAGQKDAVDDPHELESREYT